MEHVYRVLEFDAVKEQVISQCETSLGAVLADGLGFIDQVETVKLLREETKEAYQLLAVAPPPSLGGVRDLSDALLRCSKGGSLNGQELYLVGSTMSSLRGFRHHMQAKRADFPRLWSYCEWFLEEPKLEGKLLHSLDSDGTVLDGASETLGALRRRIRSTNSQVTERIQSYTTGKHRDLLSDPIYTVRDGRFVIPLKAEHRGKIKGIVHDSSASGQTIYLEPDDVLQLGNRLREAEAAERQEVQRVLNELSDSVRPYAEDISQAIAHAGDVDLILAKGRHGYATKASLPQPSRDATLKIEGGRHPLLPRDEAVPIDLEVGFEFQGLLITGPNTGGKTVAMKTAGLFVLMAQCGLMLPARDVKLGHFTQLWADIGDEQSLQQSLSTFSGHIRNIAAALKGVRRGALVLFDEIGAGTDPAEGAALAKAILLAFQAAGAVIIASTHYGELKAFAYNTPGFQNAAMEFDSKSLRPTYRVLLGAPGASHALKIAERYGIPSKIIEEAKAGLTEQEQEVGLMLEKLEQSQRQARLAQSQADKRDAELRRAEDVAKRKLAEADEIRRNVHRQASEKIDDVLRELRLETARVLDEIKSGKSIEEAKRELKDIQERGEKEAAKYREPIKRRNDDDVELTKGMTVRVDGFTQIGTLLEDPSGDMALTQMGPLKLKLKVALMTAVESVSAKRSSGVNIKKSMSARTEISLRAMRAEDAELALSNFIDEAVLAGLHQIRIVHGKGEGILRKLSHDLLRRHRDVKSFRDGDPEEGGAGVTIALFG